MQNHEPRCAEHVAAAPRLATLAREHPFTSTRERAAAAHEAVTGVYVEPGRGRCPRGVTRSGDATDVWLKRGPLRLTAIARPRIERAWKAGRCGGFIVDEMADVALERGEECLLGVNRGEFGGWVEARSLRTQAARPIVPANPLELIDDGHSGVLLLEGLAHLGYAGGSVVRLRSQRGRWISDDIVRLEGVPVAFRVEGDDLLVLTHDYAGPGCGKRSEFVLVRVAPDGGIEAVD